jgi:malate synthase
LALPDGDHLLHGEPMPLHLVELVQHIWLNRERPEARVLYFPKLENEEEAAYLATAIGAAERAVARRFPDYPIDSVRVILVFENPRAIFRIREMGEALHPYFLGGSLGWHDFLASTARLFRHDPKYRIPVKADPDIVIRNIRESHHILVQELAESGALKIGGMYGILYQSGDLESFTACMVGYIRDVVTQLKRGLDGFWVAHPDFVRIGIALVEAWRQQQAAPAGTVLHDLVRALVPLEAEWPALLAFIDGPDVAGLDEDDPLYLRAVLASELGVSPVVANDDPEEVRYNVFQALQYLADWLRGNGCVALPAKLKLGTKPVFVRVMDDLATTERSRWEVWAEVQHDRVSLADFEAILAEEVAFIQEGKQTDTKRTEVRWEGEAARWYPMAVKLLRQLMTEDDPPEFVTELLMPFTFPAIRDAEDPWAEAMRLCPGKFCG